MVTLALFASLALSWIAYTIFGHRLIAAIYNNESIEPLNRLIAGRGSTPLEEYFRKADQRMWNTTAAVLAGWALVALLIKTRLFARALIASLSILVVSLVFFALTESFPSVIPVLHLDRIRYFAYRARFIPDSTLVFRNRSIVRPPGLFFGDKYSPDYGVLVRPLPYDAAPLDKDGFAEAHREAPADVVLIGDSYIGFRLNAQDSFGTRLASMSGMRVASLAVAGYGPYQYLEMLKRHAVLRRPKYVVFCFFEGNDLADMRMYLHWKAGGDYYFFSALTKSFLARYIAAVTDTTSYIQRTVASALADGRTLNGETAIHPDVAALQLGPERHRVLFAYRSDGRTLDEIRRSPEWPELTRILAEFKSIATAQEIVPIVLYLPTAAHIHAEYSTAHSGERWLQQRAGQILNRHNVRDAMAGLARELRIEMIDLTPAFEAAARSGKLLFYPFDTHWNSEGRQLAAERLARALPARGAAPSR